MLVGSKGGGSASFVQKPDNLRSTDTFEGLIGLVAGPIKGPVNGLQSVRINGTPVEDATGKANFDGVTSFFADGDPLKFPQKPTLKLGSAGSPDSVGTQLRNTTGTGVWTTATMTNLNAEAVDLRFVVNTLYKQDKKGIFNHTAHLEIQMKPSGTTTWINPFNGQNASTTYPTYQPEGYEVSGLFGMMRYMLSRAVYDGAAGNFSGGSSNVSSGPYLTITGKTTSPFIKELRVELPNTGTYANKSWDIRVRLVEKESVDNDPNFEKRNITWESLTAVYSKVLGEHEDWRALSWLQVYGTASDNFNGVPEVDGIYDLKIVSVPPSTVFNPDTRVYTGTVWDGSWAKAWTTDPAWIINDAISDSISGLAAFCPGAHLNKWDALELSKWCSEQVSDGAGGTHPRFSLNLYVDQPQKSDEFIRYLAGAVGATAWDNGGGEWRVAVDRPKVPVDIFTSETIEGEFQYSHTDVDTRFNDVTVVFLNEEFDYREDRVRLVNQPDIDKNGRKPTKVVGIGITNRQQAIRWAVLRLRTNVNEFRAVTFTTNRRGKLLERFNHILIADGSLNTDLTEGEIRSTGRIIQNKGGSVVVRDPMRLEVGVTYKLHFTAPNPNYNPEPTGQPTGTTWQLPTTTLTRNVTNTAGQRGNVTEIFIDSALPADVAANANVALEAVGLPAIPKTFRVLDIDYQDDGERITINAMEVDTGKWDAADNADEGALDLVLDPFIVPPPTVPAAGVWSVGWFTSEFAKVPVLTATWERPALAIFDYYKVEYRINDGPWQDLGTTRENFYEFQQPQFGKYEIRVCAVARRNNVSLPLTASYELLEYQLFPPVGYLTNETHTVAAAADGTGFSLTGAGGLFILNYQLGNISSGVTYSVLSETGCDVSINATTGAYTVNSLSADQGKATFRAVWQGFTIDKEYSITKSKAGGTGATGPGGPVIAITADTQGFTYVDGVASPTTQTITLTAIRQNTTESVNWSVSPAVTLGGTGLTRTLSLANFGSNRQVTVTATGATSGITDKITLVRLDLSTAEAGATVGAVWDTNLDGIPDNLAVLVGTEAIKNQAILDVIANDNILSRTEKQGNLATTIADIVNRYRDLIARASAAGISTTNLTNYYTNWYDFLDTNKAFIKNEDTTIYTNAWGDEEFDAVYWTADETITNYSTSDLYKVQDTNTTGWSTVRRSKAIASIPNKWVNGSNYLFMGGLVVQKKSSFSYTACLRMNCQNSSGTVVKYGDLVFDACNGVVIGVPANLFHYDIHDCGDCWLVFAGIETTADTVYIAQQIFPAYGPTTGGADNTKTGSMNIKIPLFVNGGYGQMGKYMLAGLTGRVVGEMTRLAKALSERDGTTGLVINPVAQVVISADTTGVIKTGQLPRNVAVTASVGTATVTTLGSWSLGTLPEGITCTIGAATGVLNITALTAANVLVPINFVYNGVTRSITVNIVRQDDPPTNSGGTTSGGGTTVTTTTLANTTGTTYDLTNAVSATLTAKAGSAGQVVCTAPITFRRTNTSVVGNTGAAGKWQWRVVGGSWADIDATEVTQTTNCRTIDSGDGMIDTLNGSISVTKTKTGLTAGTSYEFRFVWRHVSNSGTSSTIMSVSGTLQAAGS